MFNTVRIYTTLFLFLSLAVGVFAQTYNLKDVLQARSRGTGPIIKDGVVTGYYSFYLIDKKDKKTRTYQLEILDQNLTPLSSKKFAAQENLLALEAAYNGELLMIKFGDYQTKEAKYSLKMYNQNAEQVGSKSLSAEKVYDMFEAYRSGDEELEDVTITPIEGKGFVHAVTKLRGGRMSHTYNEITFVPNKPEEKGWKWETNPKSEDFEWGEVMGCNENVLLYLTTKRKKLMSADFEEFIMGLDIKTGRKLFEKPIEDARHSVSTMSSTIDSEGNFRLFGYFFEKEAKTGKASSLGFFGFKMDTTGKIIERKYESWEKDVAKFLKVSERGKIKDIGKLYFHKFVQSADGKIFGIAEQYKTNVGASIALSMLGHSASNFTVEDMYIFEFDSKFDLKNVSVFDKNKSTLTFGAVPIGGGRTTGIWLNMTGSFDYSFTQTSKNKEKFSIGYVDYDRKKDTKGLYFGSINYSDGKFATDKIKLDKKATFQKIYPGKPGYVMVMEYFKKEKKLEFRMEKLNF